MWIKKMKQIETLSSSPENLDNFLEAGSLSRLATITFSNYFFFKKNIIFSFFLFYFLFYLI